MGANVKRGPYIPIRYPALQKFLRKTYISIQEEAIIEGNTQ